ncbi:MAG: FAD:protein FMN transferase [Clostridia bacterium]|nr:FAD:protein FMN transferase [Clostridia bacterium]
MRKSRRGSIKKIIIAALLAVTSLTAFSSCGQKRFSETYTDVFDTVTTFTACCQNKNKFAELSQTVHDELKRIDAIFSIYNEKSSAFAINTEKNAIICDDMYQVLLVSREFYDKTGGKLNIAMGSVLSLWHEFRENGRSLPEKEALMSASAHADMDNLHFTDVNAAISDPDMTLDFGAVAKGYAADAVSRLLDCDFILNIGGNVYAGGHKEGGSKWSVGVENPDGGLLTVLAASDVSVVTSGDYQRYRELNGVRYHHIIDSETLYPSVLYRSVTIIHTSSLIADALSTALFCMDIESGRALALEYGAEALWMKNDGTLVRTDGFANYEK